MTKPRGDLDPSVAFSLLLDLLPGFAESVDGDATVRRFLIDWYRDPSRNMYEFAGRWVANELTRTVVLASGRLADVAPDGSVTLHDCPELVDMGYAPEPTHRDDRIIGACGAPMRALPGWETVGAWTCDAGHRYLGLEAELGPGGAEWKREMADRRDHGVYA